MNINRNIFNKFAAVTKVTAALLFFLIGFAPKADAAGWMSPTGSVDSENKWTNDNRAYDGDTATYASDGSQRVGYGAFLELTLPSTITASRVRVNADWGAQVDAVDIDIYRSGAWVDVYEGAVANCSWDEKTFTSGDVSSVRFRYHYTAGTYLYWLYELEIYEDSGSIVLPSVDTLDATMEENTSAILHGQVVDDGGEPCDYRFQYGLTASYGTDTTWRSGVVTGQEFTQLITGLTNAQNYHFRVQLRNGAGTTDGDDMVLTTGTLTSGWVSPTGHSDPDTAWDDEDYAYDDMLSTYAKSFHDVNDANQWSSYLYLSHDAITSDRLRFYARGNPGETYYVDQVNVDVFKDGAWVDVYQGAFNHMQWCEYTFTQGTVTEARIQFHINSASAGLFYQLYEFNFYRISFNAPTLAWTGETNYVSDGVNPQTGDQNTQFEFRVEYTDADNDGPTWKKLFIDKNGDGDYDDAGEQLEMILATDAAPAKRDGIFTNGEIYTVTTTVPYSGAGGVSYYFGANDGTNDATGTPTLVVNNSPTIVTYLDFQTVPSSVFSRNYFSVTVKATDGTGTVDPTKTYAVTLSKESGTGSLYSDTALTQNLVAGVYTWSNLYIVTPGDYTLRVEGNSQTAISATITVTDKSMLLDDYDGVGDLTYSTANTGTSYWNVTGGYYDALSGGSTAPEHSYASYDLSQSFANWNLSPSAQNRWCGWMDLNFTNNNQLGWRTGDYACAMVLSANSGIFLNPGVSGYAIGLNQSTRRLGLFKFSDGIHGNNRPIPVGATLIEDTTFSFSTGMTGVNFFVEYNTDGTWTISYLAGAALSATQAVDKANYTGGSMTTAVDTTYSGSTYKYAGWVYAHGNSGTINATFDNFGAYAEFPAPVATAATALTANTFTANWNAVSGATDYRLDVSEASDFSSFLTGYKNLTVAGLSQLVTVPNGGTYYYRVRAHTGSLFSSHSNTITVLITTILSVTLKQNDLITDYNTWAISGIQNADQAVIMDGTNCVSVVNDGTVAEDFSVRATASTWTLGATTGQDQCVLMGLFNGGTAPVAGDFNTTYDLISGTEKWSTVSGGNGAFEGLDNGTNVAASANRKFYIYLKTPSSVTSGTQQSITVTIGCMAH